MVVITLTEFLIWIVNIRYSPVKNVSTDATYVISDQEKLQSRMYKMFPEDFEEKTKQYKPTGRPAGWLYERVR